MRTKLFLTIFILGIIGVIGGGFVAIKWYPYVFAKRVRGEILRVEKVAPEGAIITTGNVTKKEGLPAQLFSFAIAIRDGKGEIHTTASEDRQWAVAETGQCVEAKFFRYPFWEFDKANTFFGARLERLFDCKSLPADE